MKTIRFILLLCIAVISGTLNAQSQRELGELMRNRGEYYFTLSVNDRSEIQAISNLCSVDGTDGRAVVCYANQREYDKLLQLGYEPNLQTPPSLRQEAKMWDGNRATYEWDSYPTYGQYETMMQSTLPNSAISGRTCTYMELGTLTSGRKIMGVRINNGVVTGKPKFLYSSTIHGDETTGMILMLRLIEELCTSTDSRIVNLVNNLDIFIFPDANPDGTYYGGNNTVTGSRRANGNNVDMNRNYPDPHSSEHPDGNAWQSETQWFMQLAEDYPFTMAANFHGGAEVMNYPWDNTSTRHADDAWWQYVSNQYVAATRAVYSSYMTDTYSSGITNGADWYMIGGGRQDYMNGYHQCREITIECSSTKTLPAAQLNSYWNYNHSAMLGYMEQCLYGVHGIVKDATTNQPIDGVTVTVMNHDDEYSIVSTHEGGYFHRPIKGGSYTFKFTKEGYCNEYVNVTVADGASVNLPVFLTPEGNCPVVLDCYEQTTQYAAGSYVMGYLDGTKLFSPTRSGTSTIVSSTSVEVSPTDNGFSVIEGTAVPQYTLTVYSASNGQYYIKYGDSYLTRSSNGNSLTWSSSTSSYGRWYFTNNGIYVSRNNTKYYLYFNTSNNSFTLSTTAQNIIKLYVPGDCPTPQYTITASVNPTEGGSVTGAGTYDEGATCTLTASANEGYDFVNWTLGGAEVSTETTYSFEVTGDIEVVANFEESTPVVEQIITLKPGWNWWSTYLEGITFGQLMEALDNNVTVTPQNGGSISDILPNKMYIIHSEGAITSSISGPMVDASLVEITLNPGVNWIGYPLNSSLPVTTALAGVSPAENDVIKYYDGSFATYSGGTWHGTLRTLNPGKGYIYQSNASQTKTFVFPTNH